jgi:hypothetical protein
VDTRAREPRSLVTWPTRVRRGVGVCDRRRASTASSGSSSVDGVFRFATRGSYAVSVYSAMADSVEYKLRYAVSSPLPGTMVRSCGSRTTVSIEFIVPPSRPARGPAVEAQAACTSHHAAVRLGACAVRSDPVRRRVRAESPSGTPGYGPLSRPRR